jgi:YfiH family protein
MHTEYLTINRLNEIGNIAHAFTTRECRNIEDILKNKFGLSHSKIFTVKQVHSDKIFVINSQLTTRHSPLKIEADAIITNMKNLPIGIFTADCIPVILADIKGRAVGIVHAGRVGTSLKISKKSAVKMMEMFDIQPEDIIAAVGPGIGGCCYEVDEKSVNPFKEEFAYFKDITVKKGDGKWMLDLKEANVMQLKESGFKSENIFTVEFCTSCHNDRFFSYRREGKEAGRMVSFIAIKE